MKKLERCGFCGRYFRGLHYLSQEELEKEPKNISIESIKLGYCPNAQQEHQEQDPQEFIDEEIQII